MSDADAEIVRDWLDSTGSGQDLRTTRRRGAMRAVLAERDRLAAEVERLRAEAARFAAQRDDLAGVIERRNRKLNWTRGQLEAAEDVVDAARRVRWTEKHEEGIADAHVELDRALGRYDARRG